MPNKIMAISIAITVVVLCLALFFKIFFSLKSENERMEELRKIQEEIRKGEHKQKEEKEELHLELPITEEKQKEIDDIAFTNQVFIDAFTVFKAMELEDESQYIEPLTIAEDISEVLEYWKEIDLNQANWRKEFLEDIEDLEKLCSENEYCRTNIELLGFIDMLTQGIETDPEIFKSWKAAEKYSYLTEERKEKLTEEDRKALATAIGMYYERRLKYNEIANQYCDRVKDEFNTVYQYKSVCEQKEGEDYIELESESQKIPDIDPYAKTCLEFKVMMKEKECGEVNEEFKEFIREQRETMKTSQK